MSYHRLITADYLLMKICVITTVFPRWYGDGEGAFLWQFVKILAQRGIEVRVVAMHSPHTVVHEFFDDIEIIRTTYWWPRHQELLRKDGGGLPINVRKYPLARFQLLSFASMHLFNVLRYAQGCDLIHAHFTLSAAVACLGKQIHRRPVVATVHGSDIFQVPQYPGGTWFTRKTLLACDQVTTVSQALRKATINLGVPQQQLSVISNSIDTAEFIPLSVNRRDDVILFVGSLIKRKGLAYLLAAMKTVFCTYTHYRLVLIGEGPEQAHLQAKAEQLGIASRVDFLGALPQVSVRDWMQRAKLFVLPSTEEGQGVVALEALACATPVVASTVGGIPDIVPTEVGALVPPADPIALADAILRILDDEPLWLSLSKNARAYILAHFDGAAIGGQYCELYQALLSPAMQSRNENS